MEGISSLINSSFMLLVKFPDNTNSITRATHTGEAVIDANIDNVYKAVIDENDGKTNWWMPHRSSKLLKGDSCGNLRI